MRLSNDLRTSPVHAAALAVCCFLAGSLFHNEVNAAGTPVPLQNLGANQFFWHSNGAGIETLSLDTYGTRLVSSSADHLSVSNGAVNLSRGGQLALRPGVNLPVTATAKVAGAAAGTLLLKAIPLVGALTTGYAIYDFLKELGIDSAKNPDGSVSLTTPNPEYCALNASCTQWQRGSGADVGPWSFSLGGACNGYASYMAGKYPGFYSGGSSIINGACYIARNSGGNDGPIGGATRTFIGTAETAAAAPIPTTPEAVAQKVANTPTWPDNSNLPRALDQAQRLTGDTIPTANPKISGPSSVTGPSSTTTTPTPTGTKETTSQDTFDCHYNDPSYDGTIPGTVVCTQKTTTSEKVTATDPQTGQTTTTTTQTSETIKPADPAAQKPLETKDPCDENPDRAGCAILDTPQGEIPKVTKTFNYQYEELGLGNGSCPAPVTVNTSNGSYTLNLGQYCDAITTYVRPVVILFGMLAAFFIAIPVKTENA